MEEITKPACRIEDCSKEERLVMFTIIRELIKPMKELTSVLGFEGTEEQMTKFINEGIIHVVYDEDRDGYYLRIYDFNEGRYRP